MTVKLWSDKEIEEEKEFFTQDFVEAVIKLSMLWFASAVWANIFLRPGREVIYFIGGIFFFVKGLDLIVRVIRSFKNLVVVNKLAGFISGILFILLSGIITFGLIWISNLLIK